MEITTDKLLETVSSLKNEYNMLVSISGVDTPEGYEVIYHLYSTQSNKKIILKVKLSKSNPQIESLCGFYSSANWHEREVYDMFGINFLNHPELIRILMPCDWKGHPLRKDYVNDDERLSWNQR